MSRSPAHDLAMFLVSGGVGAFGGSGQWSVNVAAEPSEPVASPNVVTLYDTGGQSPDTSELDLLRPTIQVRVRAEVYATGYAKQETIRDLLTLGDPVVVSGGATFYTIEMSSDILNIGRDDKNRFLLTANYRAIKQRS